MSVFVNIRISCSHCKLPLTMNRPIRMERLLGLENFYLSYVLFLSGCFFKPPCRLEKSKYVFIPILSMFTSINTKVPNRRYAENGLIDMKSHKREKTKRQKIRKISLSFVNYSPCNQNIATPAHPLSPPRIF